LSNQNMSNNLKPREKMKRTLNVIVIGMAAMVLTGCVTTQTGMIPRGTIEAWTGDISSPPDGWAVCDGKNGTPNLQGKFLRGVVVQAEVGQTGGSDTFSATVTKQRDQRNSEGFEGEGMECMAGTVSGDNLPPYYNVIYIIKK
jgi:hypothetical protein